jgi:C4-dicarboxylate-specific signal transduction histidine kinase
VTVARTAAVPSPQGGAETGSVELQRFANAGRLASAVAHDMLSSLGVAQTDVGFLCELFDHPERRIDLREAAEDARVAITRAVARIAAVISLARERQGEIGPLDVKEVIGAALFDLDARLVGRTVVTDLQSVPFALAERGALLQTLVSALLDAADSTPARGRIGITLRAEGGWVAISIDDEGPSPIAPETLADRAGSPLWICRNVVRAFGGELATGQAPLGGRRVTVKLRTERVSRDGEGD